MCEFASACQCYFLEVRTEDEYLVISEYAMPTAVRVPEWASPKQQQNTHTNHQQHITQKVPNTLGD